MTKHRVLTIVGLTLAAILLAAAIASAGGFVGYVIGRRSLTGELRWGLQQREGQVVPGPFFQWPPATGREFMKLTSGALVTSVEKGSPAEQAGIKAGDVITAVDDQEIDQDHPLADLISGHQPGDKVTVTLNRSGESKEIEVTLGTTTGEAGKTSTYLGVYYRSVERREVPQAQGSEQSYTL